MLGEFKEGMDAKVQPKRLPAPRQLLLLTAAVVYSLFYSFYKLSFMLITL